MVLARPASRDRQGSRELYGAVPDRAGRRRFIGARHQQGEFGRIAAFQWKIDQAAPSDDLTESRGLDVNLRDVSLNRDLLSYLAHF